MTREEFLMEKFTTKSSTYVRNHMAFYRKPSIARMDPFKMADQLYYVGDKLVCVHLLDTGDGLILFDSGFFGAAHILVDSIWRAGFDPRDVRWIIHTHGHYDHFGASEEFRVMYGTKLAISRVDAEMLREKPHRAHIKEALFPLAKVPEFDYEIEDGEIFEMGNMKIRCVLTPGHTYGVLSFFFDVTYEGKTYLAGMFGGAGTDAVSLPYTFRNDYGDDCAQNMLDSVAKLWDEPVEIHMGNHPGNNHTLEKRALQLEQGGNPFIDPSSWQEFLGRVKKRTEEIIVENEALEKELQGMQ